MITYHEEKVIDLRAEIEPLLEEHYQYLVAESDRDKLKLSPDWGMYIQLQNMGMLALYALREHGRLIGYASFIVTGHFHYADLKVATNELLFITASARNGLRAARFIRHCEAELKKLGVNRIGIHSPVDHDFSPLLQRLGYRADELLHSKHV